MFLTKIKNMFLSLLVSPPSDNGSTNVPPKNKILFSVSYALFNLTRKNIFSYLFVLVSFMIYRNTKAH